MKKYTLTDLNNLKGLAERAKNNPVRKEYWKEEEEFLVERAKKSLKEQKMIEMDTLKMKCVFFK